VLERSHKEEILTDKVAQQIQALISLDTTSFQRRCACKKSCKGNCKCHKEMKSCSALCNCGGKCDNTNNRRSLSENPWLNFNGDRFTAELDEILRSGAGADVLG
jgi:hypothetical protein